MARKTAVVMVDDPMRPADAATIVEVTGDDAATILRRYADRDGAKPDRLRLWAASEGDKPGDRVMLP